jgi:hypothetical protein
MKLTHAERFQLVPLPVDVTDARRFPNINRAIAEIRADAARYEALMRDWQA